MSLLPILLFHVLFTLHGSGHDSMRELRQVPEEVKVTSNIKALLGEGSIWDHRRQVLYWIDIENGILFEYDPVAETTQKHFAGKKIGTVVPESVGTVILAMEDGIYRMNLKDDSLEFLCKPETLRRDQRFNDGKCDPAGRLWVGSMGPSLTAFLYCMDSEKQISERIDSISTSNGITWSLDSTRMYYIDTPTSCVREYSYDVKTGKLGKERIAVSIPKSSGYPDGMTIDTEGMLWIAQWGGYGVYRYDPVSGQLLQKIPVPVKNVTSCAFGGKNLDILFITTVEIGNQSSDLKDQPYAGRLFRVVTGQRGIEANYYKPITPEL